MVKVFACGVNEYRGAINLDFCVNDSREFCSAFQENIIINQEDITIATDDGEISNTEYCKRLKEFCDASSEEDILVVFHSGHGGVDEHDDSFLLMTNSLNESTYVYTDQIINFLNCSKAKSKVVILDCCHSDVGDKFIPPIDEEEVVEKFYGKGITVFCACKKWEESTTEDGKISVFTKFLCESLKSEYLIRDNVVYFNDLQNMVSIYAQNYNRKHPGEEQTPVMRTSMIGTLTLPARILKEKRKKQKYFIETREADILDIENDCKTGKNKQYRKYYSIKVVMKKNITEETIVEEISKVVKTLKGANLPLSSKNQILLKNHPIEIVYILFYSDYIDYKANIYKYLAVWTLYDDYNWHKKNVIKINKEGYYSWDYNSLYQYLKKMRLQYIFTDDELISFWKNQIAIVIRKTSQFDREYHSYKIGDMDINQFCKHSNEIYSELQAVYNQCDDACFPMPYSKYEKFHDKSYELVTNARSLVFISASYKKENSNEKNLKDCIELELKNYYKTLKEWEDIMQIEKI